MICKPQATSMYAEAEHEAWIMVGNCRVSVCLVQVNHHSLTSASPTHIIYLEQPKTLVMIGQLPMGRTAHGAGCCHTYFRHTAYGKRNRYNCNKYLVVSGHALEDLVLLGFFFGCQNYWYKLEYCQCRIEYM